MKQNTIINIISILLVLLFVYTGVSKLAHFTTFTGDMNNQPLPAYLKSILVWAVPAVELIIAVFLIFNTTRLMGLYASLALMLAFTVYTGFVLLNFFAYIPCSCGGIIKTLTWPQHLALNLFFVLIAAIGILKYPLSPKHYNTGQ